MNRLQTTAAAIILSGLAVSGCAHNRTLPNRLAPSNVTTLAVNSYLWRAAVDTVSFAPLLQANPNSGVIITDWYTNPRAPGERVKLTVAVLDPDLRADALRVSAARQVNQNGVWVDAPVAAATVQKLEDIILTRARDLRRAAVPG
jgi:outer membrane murein-binding lipoprotein Lpp